MITMKKHLIRLIFCILGTGIPCLSAYSQSMQKGTSVLSIGLGAPGGVFVPGGAYGETVFYSPSLDLSFEKGVIADIPHSLIGLGGYLSSDIHTDDYSDNAYYYNNHWTDFILGVKGWYHLDYVNKDKYDVFATLMLGVRISAYSYSTNDPGTNNGYYRSTASSVGPAGSISVGARYWFKPKVGVYGELGAGHDFAVIGLCFKP
jgi:hypothetical protein